MFVSMRPDIDPCYNHLLMSVSPLVSRERSKGGERVLIDSIALVTSTKPSKKQHSLY